MSSKCALLRFLDRAGADDCDCDCDKDSDMHIILSRCGHGDADLEEKALMPLKLSVLICRASALMSCDCSSMSMAGELLTLVRKEMSRMLLPKLVELLVGSLLIV